MSRPRRRARASLECAIGAGLVLSFAACGKLGHRDAGDVSSDGGSGDAGALLDAALRTDGGASMDAGPPSDASVDPVATTCGDVDGTAVCAGTLDPTTLASGVEPVAAGIVAGDPGLHWFGRPRDPGAWSGRLLIHLVGTRSDPADDHAFPEAAAALGFASIAPMYENRDAVRGTCGDDDACYEAFHREIVYGEAVAADPIDVDAPNSIHARVGQLLDRLAAGDPGFAGWATLASAYARDDWSPFVLSGHSQGSGHAVYLARDFAAERAVILAGPADRLNDGTPSHATVAWLEAFGTTPPRTPIERFYGYIHEDDSLEVVEQVVASWDAMGLDASECTYAAAGGYPAGCRRVFIPADRCGAIAAHTTVVVRRWGNRCALGFGTNTNAATWRFLLE